jgi:hypothetical protein
MTDATELKDIAINKSWAFEELVFDEKMKDCNSLQFGTRKARLSYLKTRLGDTERVVARLAKLSRKEPPAIAALDMWVWFNLQQEGWVEELVYREKKKEALELFESVQAMFGYLKERYGGAVPVLHMLRSVCRVGERRKTLWREQGGR